MFRTFIFGILLGAVLTAAAAYLIPPVDQRREASAITVQPNGGSREAFYVDLPRDRVLAGGSVDAAVPAGLNWSQAPVLADSRVELFKVRNERGAVIGVASRIAGPAPDGGRTAEWALHLPARGTLYLVLDPERDDADARTGALRAGTREFANLHGTVTQRFLPAGAGEDAGEGRIELVTVRRGAQGGGA